MSELEAKNIIKKSVEIAKQARDESKIGMLFKIYSSIKLHFRNRKT